MRPSVTKCFTFDTAHRVLGHKGKCRHLHGHTFRAEVTLSTQDVNELGMVVDFGDVKALVGAWIDKMWDHNIILHPDDPLMKLAKLAETGSKVADAVLDQLGREVFSGKPPYTLACGRFGNQYANPTAENLARELFHKTMELIAPVIQGVTVLKVRVYETEGAWADYPQNT